MANKLWKRSHYNFPSNHCFCKQIPFIGLHLTKILQIKNLNQGLASSCSTSGGGWLCAALQLTLWAPTLLIIQLFSCKSSLFLFSLGFLSILTHCLSQINQEDKKQLVFSKIFHASSEGYILTKLTLQKSILLHLLCEQHIYIA